MAGDSSFDIVSKVDRQEVDNALNQAPRRSSQRFDFKNTGASIAWRGDNGVEISANAEERALAALDVFKDKLVKRGVSLKALDAGEPRQSGREVKIDATLKQGITQEQAKKIGKLIRDEGPKGVKVAGAGRRAAGVEQEARRPAGRDRAGQGAGLRLRGAVRQLPLTRRRTARPERRPGCRVAHGRRRPGRRTATLRQSTAARLLRSPWACSQGVKRSPSPLRSPPQATPATTGDGPMPEDKGAVWLAPAPPIAVLSAMNVVMRPLLASRLGRRISGVMLLEFRGRRTGRTIKVPANFHNVDGVPMAFTDRPWRLNFEGGAPVTVTHRGRAHKTQGTLVRMTPKRWLWPSASRSTLAGRLNAWVSRRRSRAMNPRWRNSRRSAQHSEPLSSGSSSDPDGRRPGCADGSLEGQ